MRKEVISVAQAYILIITFVKGTAVIMTNYSIAKQDTWLALLIAILLTVPLFLMYGSILNMYPGKDIFQIMELVFGKIIGKIASLALIFYAVHLATLSARNLTEYIKVVSFPETPIYFSTFLFGLLILYTGKHGIEVLARVNKFMHPFLIFLTILTIILMFAAAKWTNILPVLYDGWMPVLKASSYYLSLPFGETVIMLGFLNKVDEEGKGHKIFLYGLLIGGLLLLNVILRNILVLGFPLLSLTTFPSNYSLRVLDLTNFIRGFDIIATIRITISVFVKVAACVISASIGMSRVLDLGDYKLVTVPITLLVMSLSLILTGGILDMIEWATNYYTLYTITFQILIPLTVLIVGAIRKNKAEGEN